MIHKYTLLSRYEARYSCSKVCIIFSALANSFNVARLAGDALTKLVIAVVA